MRWMIYGANGYAGKLIAREAKVRGMEPILAGRSAAPIAALAAALTLEHCAFGIADPAQMAEQLAGVGLVLNCEQITRSVPLPGPRSVPQRIGWDGPKSAALIH